MCLPVSNCDTQHKETVWNNTHLHLSRDDVWLCFRKAHQHKLMKLQIKPWTVKDKHSPSLDPFGISQQLCFCFLHLPDNPLTRVCLEFTTKMNLQTPGDNVSQRFFKGQPDEVPPPQPGKFCFKVPCHLVDLNQYVVFFALRVNSLSDRQLMDNNWRPRNHMRRKVGFTL